MSSRGIALASLVSLVLGPLAYAAEPEPSQADRLYRAYEELNVPGNLAIPFYGGAPPAFVMLQAKLLQDIAGQPAKESVPVLGKIVGEYLERVTRKGPEGFRTSPLAALQVPLVLALSKQARDPEIQARLDAMVKHPLIMELARGRALGFLAEQRLRAVPPETDPTGSRRRQILFDTLLGGKSLAELLHTPARLNALAEQVVGITGYNPAAAAKLFATGADAPARRYAADYAITVVLGRKLNEGMPLNEQEMDLFTDVAKRYGTMFFPEVRKERYASRLLGDALLHLSSLKGNEAIAGLLADYGLEPPPPPPEPAIPPVNVEEEPAADEPVTRLTVAKLLAETVDAIQKDQEAGAERLLGKLATPAALPVLQESLVSAKTDPPTRAAILRALARNGSEQAIFALLESARHTDDLKQLEPIVFALTEVRNPASVPALLEAVFDGTSTRLGGACAHVLARLPGADKARSLVRAYQDKDYEAIALLVALAKDWKSERTPYAGLAGLATLGMPEAVEALFDLLGEKDIRDDRGRSAAVERALGEAIGSYAHIPEILAVALQRLQAASPKVRLAAAQALAGVDEAAVRKSLEEAAQTEKDPDIAKTLKSLLRARPAKETPPPPPPIPMK